MLFKPWCHVRTRTRRHQYSTYRIVNSIIDVGMTNPFSWNFSVLGILACLQRDTYAAVVVVVEREVEARVEARVDAAVVVVVEREVGGNLSTYS